MENSAQPIERRASWAPLKTLIYLYVTAVGNYSFNIPRSAQACLWRYSIFVFLLRDIGSLPDIFQASRVPR